MARHRVYLPDCDHTPGSIVEITGPEAFHAARAKRMGVGDELELFNGRGRRVVGIVREVRKLPGSQGRSEWALRVDVERATEEPPIHPRVTVLASTPKGPRLEEMVDQLSQVGAARWAPLTTTRTVVSPGTGKILKAERVAIESAKQCGRAWTMEIGAPVPLADALAGEHTGCAPKGRLVLADASGGPFEASDAEDITLLVGPEGGFSADEIQAAREAGAVVCRFGPHVLRVETAAVVAAAVILDPRAGLPG
jgi:16S rRNA (uracil1498-N3)-methyltransferase